MVNFIDILRDPPVYDRLQQLAKYHPESYGHSVRVGHSMFHMAGLLQLASEDPTRAGLLHDFGKLRIPLSILDKGSELTPEERAIMDTHTRLGAVALNGYNHTIAEVAGGHHEFYVRPYPREKPRSNGTLAQLAALIDHFDALTHPRVYRNGGIYTLDEALRDIEDVFSGDHNLMKAFFDAAPYLLAATQQ